MAEDHRISTVPRILVIGVSLPGARDGGGVVRDEILRRYPRAQYVCFAVQPTSQSAAPHDEMPESLRGVPWESGSLGPSPSFRGARFIVPLIRFVALRFLVPLRIRQAAAFGRKHKVDLVWAELYGDAVLLGERVAKRLSIPLVGTVWDDPVGWLADGGYDFVSRRELSKNFHSALRAARNLSTAGEAMQRTYLDEYGVNSVILRHGFDFPVSQSKPPNEKDSIVIGFVGSSYGRDAWEAFLAALARINASGHYPKIRLRAFGGSEFPYQHPGVEIEARGWQPSQVMLREIAETDFCYLPYWFNPAKRRHVELSFPNKFETYLAAGRSGVFHGPAYADVSAAVKKHNVGICIHTQEQDQIISMLLSFIDDWTIRETYEQSALAAFHNEFNADVMMRNFSALIGVNQNQLPSKAAE